MARRRISDAELFALQTRVQRARWRVRTAAYGGPEWDAAMCELLEAEAELDRGRRAAPRRMSRLEAGFAA